MQLHELCWGWCRSALQLLYILSGVHLKLSAVMHNDLDTFNFSFSILLIIYIIAKY